VTETGYEWHVLCLRRDFLERKGWGYLQSYVTGYLQGHGLVSWWVECMETHPYPPNPTRSMLLYREPNNMVWVRVHARKRSWDDTPGC